MKSKEIELIKVLAWNDFKLKYSRSVIGFLWSLIKPLLMLTTLYIVFSLLINLNIEKYPLFLLLGIILWNFFSEATTNGLKILSAKANFVKKTVFPLNIIVISSVVSSFMSLLLNLAVFILFVLIFNVHMSIHALIILPFLALLFMLSLGIAYALSALYLRFRDLDHIWEVLLQIGFWSTPIVYSLSIIPQRFVKWYDLNPLARLINDSRDSVLFHMLPSPKHLMITLIECILIYFIGKIIFNSLKNKAREYV